MRNILIRFKEEDELNKKIEEAVKRLGITKSALTKLALHRYCQSAEVGSHVQ